MMKAIRLTKNIFLIILAFSYSCQNPIADEGMSGVVSQVKIKPIKTSLQELNLVGSVKTIKGFAYEAVEKSGKIDKDKKVMAYSGLHDSYNLFDKKGNRTEKFDYYLSGKLKTTWKYRYDTLGCVIEEAYFDSAGSSEGLNTYKYDTEGNLLESKGFYISGKKHLFKRIYSYSFDSLGKIIEEIGRAENSVNKCTYKHDANSNIESAIYYSNGEFSNKQTFSYDNKGRITEHNWFSSNEGLIRKCKRKYDDRSNLVEEIWSDADERNIRKLTYEYIYDLNGNWIARTDFENGIPKYIIERIIEYYAN